MERPTEFLPVYDQTQKQAADMVEKMFVEIENLEAERNELRAEVRRLGGLLDEVESWAMRDPIYYRSLVNILAKRGKGEGDGREETQ